MALIPRNVFRNWWDEMDRYHRDIEEYFHQLSLCHDDLWRIPSFPSFNNVFRPWRNIFENLDQVHGSATIKCYKNKYQVMIDVKQFAPEEIIVRTDDKCITVEGKHQEKKDKHVYVSRQFVHRYILPRDYDINDVKPNLSSDGILIITAPKLVLPALGERIVPIRRSYLPAIKAA